MNNNDNKCFDTLMCGWDPKPRIAGLVHDPIEETEGYLSKERELEEKLRLYFEEKVGFLGKRFVSCFDYWAVKKKILKEEYQLEWKSPVELNPDVFRK